MAGDGSTRYGSAVLCRASVIASTETRRRWQASWPISLHSALKPLQQGAGDPCLALGRSGAREWVWRTVDTPDGSAVQYLEADRGEVTATSWGPGAEFLAHRLPLDLGAGDHIGDFNAVEAVAHAHSARLRERGPQLLRHWRVPAVRAVPQVLVAAILGQRVTGIEAHRGWAHVVRTCGESARTFTSAAPAHMVVPPSLAQWLAIPSWVWHRAGVDAARSQTVVRCLTALTATDVWTAEPSHVRARLRAVGGYGVWTDALLATQSFGDADSVPFRDFHICHAVCHAFTGAHRGSDEQMAQLLSRWMGHRFRIVRMVALAGVSAPRHGPRLAPSDHRGR